MQPDRGVLSGRRVVVTRPAADAPPLCEAFRSAGATVVRIPAFRIAAVEPSPLAAIRERGAGSCDTVVFTSRNAVRYFFEAGCTVDGLEVAAVGPSTADALERRGVRARIVGEPHTAEGLVAALERSHGDALRGRRVLYPAAADARDVLERELTARGARVDVVVVYGAVPEALDDPDSAARALASPPDVVTFASPTAVVHLPAALTPAVFERVETGLKTQSVAACIGPVTEETARRHGYRVEIIADTHTAAGLVDAVVRHFAKEG